MGGLRYVCGDPATPPSRMGISIGDSLAATFACIGALSALHHRERTGEGQIVDSAIYEAVLNMMESLITEYDKAGYIRERQGSILPNVAPSNIYPTKDNNMILIAANQDTVFKRLTEAMERPDLAEDERYQTHSARGANQVELDAIVAEWTAGIDAATLEDMMEVNERTLWGCLAVAIWPIMPPMDAPTRWARSSPRASINPMRSCAMSSSV